MPDYPEWLKKLLRDKIVDAVLHDPRSKQNRPLGHSSDWIFHDAIGGGQAPFDEPIADLSGDDRALLYAFFNQKRHIDELLHAFGQLFRERSNAGCPTLLDIGCGPTTAGLAFAAATGPQHAFRYFGIDCYQSMRDLGRRLMDEARALDALHPATQVEFSRSLDDVCFGSIRGDLTLVIASYLLASDTLDIPLIISEIGAALTRIGPGPALVLYTNSANPIARRNFPLFQSELAKQNFRMETERTERFTDTDRQPRDIHYALFSRPAQSHICFEKNV